ncbi:restriction endonuclease subunit S [Bacillus altitudinis]|uniref:restriction endonuclease subunit S n=1 Tax=Bacillus altitudinis TaxID=293387 RepID=UPI00148ED5F3|nr:restriction endonuclease subunit S [Bacillus altitudinis]NOL34821.1 restriction endonuclease subunit S [Bacillus altitudinis]WQH37796.1 restriction endonuclease subunit S [Bacillus altitudinis]
MSKKKKTIEELLEEAILPDEEQSYEVPRNWVWTRVENAIKPMETREPNKLDGEAFHYIDVDAIDNKKQLVRQIKEVEITLAPSRAKRKVSKDDVIISLVRPYLKNIAHIDIEDNKLVASTAFYVCTPKKILNSSYLYSYLCSNYATQYLIDHTRGDNSPSVRSTDYEKMPLPLPPVNEQKRIAEKVERLLSKIEEAKQLIEEAKETFELRRAAILEKAFRGELTKKWRGENLKESSDTEVVQTDKTLYNLPFNWEWIDLDTVCEKITDGTHHSPKSYPSGDYMYITAKNIKKQGILLDNVTYVSKEVHQEIYNRCDVKKGDVLYIKDGATTGIATVNQITEEFSLLSSVALLRPKRNVLAAKYLMYCLNSPSTKSRMLGMISGNAITRLTLKKIKQGIIPLPPFDEQEIIVSILEKVNSVDEQLDCVTNLEDNINNLKQSILSKAFRGELGTNDPSEESAIELLKEVLQDQVK